MAARKFDAPENIALASAAESKYNLPAGLLVDIVTKGEKSNADQVSSAGAKTIFQIIPATRMAALKKFGLDAYASAENAAEVAARLLKENLERNKGDVAKAVATYHGGTDQDNWGARTKAYVRRVTGENLGQSGGSTYDRAKATRTEDAGPSIAGAISAYKSGQMDPAARADFERDVRSGAVMLPKNSGIDLSPGAKTLPPGVVAAYVNRDSGMTDAERDELDADAASGKWKLPKGAALTRPKPLTAGENFGMGVRSVMQGIGDAAKLADVASYPITKPIDMALSAGANMLGLPKAAPVPTADQASDALGLAKPLTPTEKIIGGAVRGATGGMILGGPLVGGGRGLAMDLVANASGGASQEIAAQSGAGPVGQLVAGVVGGVGTAAAATAVERLATRLGPKVARVVETTPREIVLDEAGKLTDEGREIAARQKVTAEDLSTAYDEVEAAANEPPPQMVRTHEGVDYPVEVIDDVPVDHEGVPHIKVRGQDGAEGFVPEAEVKPVDAVVEEAPVIAPEAVPTGPVSARMQEAADLGVELTEGQALNDRAKQAAEFDMAGRATTEGNAVQSKLDSQKVALKQAADDLMSKFSDTGSDATTRGEAVKEGLTDLFDRGRQGVSAAYEKLREMIDSLKGKVDPNVLRVDVSDMRETVLDLLADNKQRPEMQRGLSEIAARYGITGESATFRPETGITKVMFRDADNKLIPGISFRGKVEPLDLTNAEKMRQDISELYDRVSGKNKQESLNPMLDDAVADATARVARIGDNGGPPMDGVDVGGQALAAREMYKNVQKTFKSGDVIERLIAWKNGKRGTPAVLPEDVFRIVYGKGPEALTNVKKLRTVLMANAADSDPSRLAWRAIQAQALADIFSKAKIANTHLGEQGFGKISGAKLNTEIGKFGVDKLKIVLDPADFDHLMKIKRVAMQTDIPLPNTTNPSGSGHVVARLLGNMALRLVPAGGLIGGAVNVVEAMAGSVKSAATAKGTLKGATEFTPAAARAADEAAVSAVEGPGLVQQFIDLAASDRLLAPLLAQSARSDQQPSSQDEVSSQ